MLISWERFSSEYYWLFQILSSSMLYFLKNTEASGYWTKALKTYWAVGGNQSRVSPVKLNVVCRYTCVTVKPVIIV